MHATLQRIKTLAGIDLAISYVLLGKLIALGTQPLVLILVGKYLSAVEQGFYFTFSNILSLSIFFELGLGTILTQFASYEFASLHWVNGKIQGDAKALDRLFSLIRQALRWYLIMAVLFASAIVPAGWFFFARDAKAYSLSFVLPWSLLVIFTALNLVGYAITALLEGCRRVSDVQFAKMAQAIMSSLAICAFLYARFGLYASTGFAFVQLLVIVSWLYLKYRHVYAQLRRHTPLTGSQVQWKKEILPLQMRIGLSWVSGYIIFQTINPVLFKFRGAIEAGHMGMTLALASLPATIGMAWLTTKIPLYGGYIQSNRHNELKKLVQNNTQRALVIAGLAGTGILTILKLSLAQSGFVLHRMYSVGALTALIGYNIVNLLINAIASYVRAFKIEPFMKSSVLIAVCTGFNVLICAYWFNGTILCYALLAQSLLVNLPVTLYIFNHHQNRYEPKADNHYHSNL